MWARRLTLLLLMFPRSRAAMTPPPLAGSLCSRSETDGGAAVRCSALRLERLPVGFPNVTVRLFLDKNRLVSLPAASFCELSLLEELDLSHNQVLLSSLEAGCFRGLESSLHLLDLSSNRLSSLDPAALGGLRAHANLTHNPWHCDCRTQLSAPQLDLDPASLSEVVCQTSDITNRGAAGIPLVLLLEDWDLCRSVRRTTDVVVLVTMLLWFSAVVCYLLFYVRQNRKDARGVVVPILALRDPRTERNSL